MNPTHADKRFFASTRGKVLILLRGGPQTVEDLARSLNVTDNAVRAHLATLERDGLVQQTGVRRGLRKPSHVYGLTPQGDARFPKAYAAVLQALLHVLRDDLSRDALGPVLRETGRRLAASNPVPTSDGDLAARAATAAEVLDALGGRVGVVEEDGRLWLRGASCPLAAVVPGHPEACRIAEALLTEATGVCVREHCDRGQPPHCVFEIVPNAA